MTATDTDTLPLGARVVDREADDDHPDAARVIRQREGNAGEVWISAVGDTVAGANPDYPADAAVVSIAFEPGLDEHLPDGWRSWTPKGIASAAREVDVTTYDYPVPRLRRVAP